MLFLSKQDKMNKLEMYEEKINKQRNNFTKF